MQVLLWSFSLLSWCSLMLWLNSNGQKVGQLFGQFGTSEVHFYLTCNGPWEEVCEVARCVRADTLLRVNYPLDALFATTHTHTHLHTHLPTHKHLSRVEVYRLAAYVWYQNNPTSASALHRLLQGCVSSLLQQCVSCYYYYAIVTLVRECRNIN